jgi:hypothetical protein
MGMPKARKPDLSEASDAELFTELARRKAAKLPDNPTMSQMERAVMEMRGNETPAIALMLERMKPEKPTAKSCPLCGKRVPVKERDRERTVRSLAGMVTFKRNYHHCAVCKEGFYPVDRLLGLPEEGDLTADMEQRVLDFALNDTFAHAAERWSLHYPEPISENLVRRVAERVGRRCAEADKDALQAELQDCSQQPGELLIVQTDGCHLPMRGSEPWKEAKLGVIVRASNYRPRVNKRRGIISRARYAAVLGGQEEFREVLSSALRAERAVYGPVVWIADGAPGNWLLAEQLAPHATQVLDWHHAIEHAMTCARTLLGEDSPLLPLWKTRCEALLASGDMDATVRELTACLDQCAAHQVDALDALIRYYRTNACRMRYEVYRTQGFPIGSGIVESAHRHVLQTRMKKAGQHWSLSRGRLMVRLRAAYRTAGALRLYGAIERARRHAYATKTPSLRRSDPFPRVGEKRGRFTRRRASNR